MNLEEEIKKRLSDLESDIFRINQKYKYKDKVNLETRVEFLEDTVEPLLNWVIELKQLLQ